MTTVVTSMRFACRRRTAADWTSGNEILLAGEIGYETDTDKFKIGDGVTPWNSIVGYFSKTGGGGSSVWGGITGTLADQLDLKAALDLKVPTSRTINGHDLSANVTLSAADVGLGNVENTALSTWSGSSNLTTLGTVGTGIWQATAVAVLYGGTGATTQSGARTNLGLAIGTDVQAYDADLAAIAALSPSANDVLQFKSGAWANRTMAQLASDLGVPALSSANTWTAQNIFAPSGSLTANAPMTYSATWNNGAIDFEGLLVSITATAAASTSSPIRVKVGGATVFSVRKDGLVVAALGFGSANQYWDFSGAAAYKYFGTTVLTLSNGSFDLNAMDLRLYAGYKFVVGGTIPTYASAATIGPINSVVAFVSGTSAIDTITSAISSGSSTAQIVHLMPTAAWTWTTAGNIAVAGTAVVGKLLTMVYSKATDKWYPSYT